MCVKLLRNITSATTEGLGHHFNPAFITRDNACERNSSRLLPLLGSMIAGRPRPPKNYNAQHPFLLSDWSARREAYVALRYLRRLGGASSREEDGVRRDAVVLLRSAPERPLRRRLLAVLPHRRDREEVLHRGDSRRDDDHR